MTKKKKGIDFIEEFCNFSIPLPWRQFVKVLTKHYGFEIVNKPGSTRLFIRDGIRFTADEPHGHEKNVSKYDRKKACDFIKIPRQPR